mmetsp:Transcript_3989/g.6997  ORF Transcript_3989/g.6997 Transcript_3989/m.6997 type:complete len:686 (-) Transcript_3989:124-2181(-)|eukprot:CAMPEP_0184523410 /NCGR_PEP_ID=MMETSP0198_2-20121128/8866_1 /TAXON_ID=1112570 /ORGANISM="Thraustochytrium sp., Strain LLF1b" /LENGTH=685 /DNA_ID=CAMNT_0026914433 /DNA_START=150 /DNA_END=2207 /DNA_ORIENTATION=-
MAGQEAKRAKADPEVDEECIKNIRILSVEMVQQANSGHPGAPMGCAPMAYALFCKTMNYAPGTPKWFNRDRFVLSNGHACALLYSMLHLTGYERPTIEDIKQFRQLDSVTAGHPENHLLEGVEIATGPLGQGISNAVGFALGEAHLAAKYNKEGHDIIDNYTFVICGDGCLQEGVSSEAGSLAGHLKLGKLIVLYDDNQITIDGNTDVSFTEDVLKRYEAYGWQVLTVSDGDTYDVSAIVDAVEEAKACTDKPTLIKIKTTIGIGAAKEGTAGVHGAPLGWDDIKKVRTAYGMTPDDHFNVSDSVKEAMGAFRTRGEGLVKDWNDKMEAYRKAFPEEAAELERRIAGDLPEGWEDKLPAWKPEDKALATRQSSGQVLNACADAVVDIVGGSADLTGSNLTALKSSHDFQAATPDGRYIRFGVREHGMAAICNGLAAYGGFIPFGATFLNFAGYALGSMRLSALCELRVLYVMTHDSIGLGEDGPTHQPVGMLVTLRSIPNMHVFRPADANEVSGAYKAALKLNKSPSVFALTRQGLSNLEHSSADKVAQGGYVVHPVDGKPDLTFVATGSEVEIAIAAAKSLTKDGIATSVVSMCCCELFDKTSEEYKKSVFESGVPVISVEAAGVIGWAKYSHYQIGMTTFGASGPIKELYKKFGFTEENLVAKGKAVFAKLGGKATWLVDPIL